MAMKKKCPAIAAIVLLACGGLFGQTPTTSELLQKGIYLQETVGDLDGAIKVYKQIVHMARQSRANAAQAEYRLGMCLLKKGRQAEATETFQKLIKEYPEQTEIVAKAREFLPHEDCIFFNPDKISVALTGGDWKILENDRTLFDFETQETNARRTLDVIKRYNLDQWCSIGPSHRSFQYLLVAGNPPVGVMPDEDCLNFNPSATKVAGFDGSWTVVDSNHLMFNFESKSEADQTLAVIMKYGFNQTCFVGRPHPKFSYMKKKFPALYPGDARTVTAAQHSAPPISRPGELKLLPAPWKDGEVLEYTRRKIADSTGVKIWRSFQSSQSNANHWLYEEHASSLFDRLEFDPETMQPANLFEAMAGHSFQLSYQAQAAQIVEDDGKSLAPIALEGPAFDAREIPAILPRLPWAKGYKVTLPLFWSDSGRVVDYEFAVTGEEDIKVPAGEFHCYSVEENDLTDRTFAFEKFWISTDAVHLIVRNDRGDWTDELAVLPESNPAESVYRDEETGTSFKVPAGWMVEKPPRGEEFVKWYLTDLHSSAFVTLRVFPYEAGNFTPEQMRPELEKSIAANKNTTVRPESWQMRQINGYAVVACVEELFHSRLQYRAWVRTGTSAADMFADADPHSFDALRPAFDAIISSLVLK